MPIPVYVFAGMLAVGLAALTGMWWVRRRQRRAADTLLKSFKEQVVGYSDAMDQIRERHKMLPFTDPDFTAPMVGDTLAAYQGVEQALSHHRDRWLELMDAWDKAQKLLESEGFTNGNAVEARKVLEGIDVGQDRQQLQQECSHQLDLLEEAHQRVDALLAAISEGERTLQERSERAQGVGLSVEPYAAGRALAEQESAKGRELREADPLHAESVLTAARQQLDDLNGRAASVLDRWTHAEQTRSAIEGVAALALQRRGEGLRMSEPQGNPDPPLADAREGLAVAIQLLNQADPAGAERHLEAADALVEQTRQAIEFQAEFRAAGERLIRESRAALERLAASMRGARQDLDQLEREHAASAWRDVADHLDHARAASDSIGQLLEEALGDVAPQAQRYFRAKGILDEVARRLPEAEGWVSAVTGKRQELDALRDAGERRLAELWGEASRLGELLRRNTADRPRSNHRHQLLVQTLDALRAEASRSRADWKELSRQLETAQNDLRTVDQLIQEDFQLAQQAEAELREAEQELRRCRGFYHMGVSGNLGQAEGLLNSAGAAYGAQDYERAIELANSAEKTAQAAVQEARRIAEERERELARRRAQETAIQVASVIAAAAAQAATQLNAQRRWQKH